ncbi:uncharacterized protein LOC143230263 isoform X5 [Tachypleus tridentatus]|uniref:uncharacterized protein LOC143230263 isoform X5 n=1 Tax=Tachypleus tridentatus TaxID=6853 RepID=UPI003FCFCA52
MNSPVCKNNLMTIDVNGGLKTVQFSVESLTEITSPLASDSMPSENNPLVTPKPISMHRSASFGTPGVQTDRRNAKPGLVATTYMSTPYFYVRQCHSLTKKTYTLP